MWELSVVSFQFSIWQAGDNVQDLDREFTVSFWARWWFFEFSSMPEKLDEKSSSCRWPKSWLQIWSCGWYNEVEFNGQKRASEYLIFREKFSSSCVAGGCGEMAGNGFCAKRGMGVAPNVGRGWSAQWISSHEVAMCAGFAAAM
jgi:hypothetical protein